MSDETKKIPVFWPTVRAWVIWVAIFSMIYAALDPRVLFATWMSTAGKIISVPEEAIGGLVSGVVIGFVLGSIAGAVRMMLPRPHTLVPTPTHLPLYRRPYVWSAVVVGVLLAILHIATSGAPAHYYSSVSACSIGNEDVTSAMKMADNHSYSDASNLATKALGENANCDEPDHSVIAALAYYTRMGAEDRMQVDFTSDAEQASKYLTDCVSKYGGAESSYALGRRCALFLDSTKRYLSQHFCVSAYQLSLRADSEIGSKAYQQAVADGTTASNDADQCTNSYAYAYKGIALVELGVAHVLDGEGDAGATELQQGSVLVKRCVSELTGANHDADLLSSCKTEVGAAEAWARNFPGAH
jgi:hypothetical protein